jgi:pyruvate/2-oxoglutarate dehydrogenase complex dihydrolipoamide acyltransferase (E2) component
MNNKHQGYRVAPFLRMRRLEINLARLSHRKNLIRGLVEVNITRARRFLREEKARTGETLSFTAFMAACLGQAVAENWQVQSSLNWRGQIILYDEVDVSILVEREHGGRKFPVAHIVRAASRKSVRAIHEEIRATQAKPMSGREVKQVRILTLLPSFVRQISLMYISKNPHLRKQYMGTVGLTAIGMFGNRGGWGLDVPFHTLGVVVGGIATRPALVEGKVVAHEYLSLTITFDHALLDGAPAARFTQRLCDLIEDAYGLVESKVGEPVEMYRH